MCRHHGPDVMSLGFDLCMVRKVLKRIIHRSIIPCEILNESKTEKSAGSIAVPRIFMNPGKPIYAGTRHGIFRNGEHHGP